MQDAASLISRHGPLLVSAVCFTEAIGLPFPAAAALLGAGALTHLGRIPAWSFAAALGGLLAGDVILYLLGRKTGWYFLGLLCRLSASPESCIYNSALMFYRRGRTALLYTKFIPGINTMAAPLAGSLNMSLRHFLSFDAAGALLYAGTYFLLGYLFSNFLGAILLRMESASEFVKVLLIAGLIAYFVYRAWLAWRLRVGFVDVPRMTAAEAAAILADRPGEVAFVDVRSHGYYEPGAMRIQGSTRFEPNRLSDSIAALPEDKLIFLYCT
jgi:membrane protein DedA with SNARE-associated domain